MPKRSRMSAQQFVRERNTWVMRLIVGVGAALALLHSAATWAGAAEDHPEGLSLYLRGDVVGAMNKLRPGSAAGHTPSQVLLAQLLEGAGLSQQAAAQYRKAAEAGDAEGQYALGAMLAEGRGVDRDDADARRWIERAATAGHAGAVNYLAQSYLRGGLGLSQPGAADLSGLPWIRQAAANGHLPALDYLARAYRSGTLVEIDVKQAEAFEAQAEKLRTVGKRARPAKK